MRRRTFIAAALASLSAKWGLSRVRLLSAAKPDLMTVGQGSPPWPYRRLFLDALSISKQSGLEHVFHVVEKYPGNPVLVSDTPWEAGSSGPYLYGTVLREGTKLRMWYQFISHGYRNAYAESKDGIHWTKPNLGLIDFHGSKANNLSLTVTQSPAENPPSRWRGQCSIPSVIPIPSSGTEPRRYALFCWGADYSKVRLAFSADGLRWAFVPETAKTGLFQSSDVVNFFYDPYHPQYVATWKGHTRRGRAVGIANSSDLFDWTKPAVTPIFTADDLDPPDTQVYGMPVFPYQGLYIGLPWIYHALPQYSPEMLMTRAEAEAESPCTVDVQLAWTWDLINWTRPIRRTPFFALGPKGSFDSEMIYTARAPVIVGEKLYFYYGGFDTRHNARHFHGAIGLATLRLDGFCSMHSGAAGGWLITRREKLTAPRIAINAATAPSGSIRAEILNLDGEVIPGFSARDCVPFTGDSVHHTLRWRTGKFTAGFEDIVKQIRFYLVRADLYSYLPLS